jgi:hypothetical protein
MTTREPSLELCGGRERARSLSKLVAEPSHFNRDFNAFLSGPDYTAVKKRQ